MKEAKETTNVILKDLIPLHNNGKLNSLRRHLSISVALKFAMLINTHKYDTTFFKDHKRFVTLHSYEHSATIRE